MPRRARCGCRAGDVTRRTACMTKEMRYRSREGGKTQKRVRDGQRTRKTESGRRRRRMGDERECGKRGRATEEWRGGGTEGRRDPSPIVINMISNTTQPDVKRVQGRSAPLQEPCNEPCPPSQLPFPIQSYLRQPASADGAVLAASVERREGRDPLQRFRHGIPALGAEMVAPASARMYSKRD